MQMRTQEFRSPDHRSARGTARVALLVVSLLAWLPASVLSATLTGQVKRVVDGDTLVVESQEHDYRVRLAGIDAPERNQPWGEASTRELRRQVAGRFVVVEWYKKDRWKRLIGIVRLNGEDQNLHMIDRGMAWHYKRYQDEQTPEDRDAYAEAENAARDARRGLWSDPELVPPWEWRRK